MDNENQLENMLHVMFDGKSYDMPLADLTIGENSTDVEVRNAAANWLGIPEQKLRSFAVDRNPDTNSVTLRPEAVFGDGYGQDGCGAVIAIFIIVGAIIGATIFG